jgi:DNA polymerase-4/DNA polymerase V
MLTHNKHFPRAILHIDGDCFFASCEIARDPSLRGKPVVTGLERGIASSMSYEAKDRGVTRGMQTRDILKVCPDAILIPSDYETYSLYSRRMYEIVRRYTDVVEEYSIDECFADITGTEHVNGKSYRAIAEAIKHELDTELGMTFSIGLSVNKVTAKIGSKWKKPNGLTIIPQESLHSIYKELPVGKLWGIGTRTALHLAKYNIASAYDFATTPEHVIVSIVNKPYYDIWKELQGEYILPIETEHKEAYKSISKTKTFTPPSTSKSFVFSQLSKNIENACIKLRRYSLTSNSCYIFVKDQNLAYTGTEVDLGAYTSSPLRVLQEVEKHFTNIFTSGIRYRATGVVFKNIIESEEIIPELFGNHTVNESLLTIHKELDTLASTFGKHTVFLGSSLQAMNTSSHTGLRSAKPDRKMHLFKGETLRRHIPIPYLGKVK